MPVGMELEQAEHDELPRDALPLLLALVRPDAEGRQPIVPERDRALARLAAQHLDEVRHPEALARAPHRGQKLLRGLRAVEARGRREAVVAAAARAAMRLAEVLEQDAPPAARGLAEGEHVVELPRLDALALGRALAALDEPAQLHDVAEAVGHPR